MTSKVARNIYSIDISMFIEPHGKADVRFGNVLKILATFFKSYICTMTKNRIDLENTHSRGCIILCF